MNQVNRPTAAEWYQHLNCILTQDGLRRCARFPGDYRHIKFAGMPCPQCDHEAKADVRTQQPKIGATTNSPNKPPTPTVASPAPIRPPSPAASDPWGLKIFLYLIIAGMVIAFILNFQDNADPTKNTNTGSSERMPSSRSSGSQNNPSNSNSSKTAPVVAPSNGFGRYVFSNGDWYQGNFLDGRPHGSGDMYYADGKKYSGNWNRGLRDGLGWLYAADGTTIYYGHWKGDEPTAMSTPRATAPGEPLAKPSNNDSHSPKTASEDVKPRYDELTALVQRELTRLGFRPGPIDGYYGQRTRSAILSFQGANGLTKDGQVSNQLLEKLASTPVLSTPTLKSNETIGRVLTVHAQQNYFEFELFGVPDVRAGDLLLIESANVTARLEKIVGMKASAVVLKGNTRLISSNATIKKIH